MFVVVIEVNLIKKILSGDGVTLVQQYIYVPKKRYYPLTKN